MIRVFATGIEIASEQSIENLNYNKFVKVKIAVYKLLNISLKSLVSCTEFFRSLL